MDRRLVVQGRTCPVYPRLAGSGGANRTDFPRRPLHLCFDGNKIAPALQVLGCMKCGTSSLHYELTKRVTRDIKIEAGMAEGTKLLLRSGSSGGSVRLVASVGLAEQKLEALPAAYCTT